MFHLSCFPAWCLFTEEFSFLWSNTALCLLGYIMSLTNGRPLNLSNILNWKYMFELSVDFAGYHVFKKNNISSKQIDSWKQIVFMVISQINAARLCVSTAAALWTLMNVFLVESDIREYMRCQNLLKKKKKSGCIMDLSGLMDLQQSSGMAA